MVRDRERWMTVGVPPKQPGLLTGQRFFVDPGAREIDLVGVAPEMSPAIPRRDVHRLDGATPLRYNSFPPVDISQTAGENLRAVLHSLFGPRILATASTVGGTWTLAREERPTEAIVRVPSGSQSLCSERAIERACAECG